MNKSESKYYNTASLMNQALLILLEKKDFDYITVKEICDKAGVNRSTFYLHYDSIDDLLAETMEYLYKQLKQQFLNVLDLSESSIKNLSNENLLLYKTIYSKPYLEFIKKNKKAFMTAVNNPKLFRIDETFDKMYCKYFEPIQKKFNVPEQEKIYMTKFFVSGIHAIIIEWIKNDCKDDIDLIAGLIEKLIEK